MKKKTLHLLIVILFIGVLGSLAINALLVNEIKNMRGEIHTIQQERENAQEKVLETKEQFETIIEEK